MYYAERLRAQYVAVCVIAIFFVALRAPGLTLPYHQDEAKYALIATDRAAAAAFSGHPPLTEFLFTAAASVFGSGGMRMLPCIASALSAILLYALVRRTSGDDAALWATAFYTVTSYGVLASLMVDTDGAVLPLMFLAVAYAYTRSIAARGHERALWIAALGVGVLAAFLVKLSAILILGALCGDALVRHWAVIRSRVTVKNVVYVGGGAVGVVAILYGALAVLPGYDVAQTIDHARSFVNFSGRGYGQIVIQCAKAFLYLSPLVVVPLLWVRREELSRMSVWGMYLALGTVFYLVIFDFSQGALDKYLMFSIVPLSAIAGSAMARYAKEFSSLSWANVGVAVAVSVAALLLLFIPHELLPLYPKGEWFLKVATGEWNIAIPFTGGSGPLGFYMSFLFAGVVWAASLLSAACAVFVPRLRPFAGMCVLCLGIAYNGAFIEEMHAGKVYGSAPAALADALAYLEAHNTPAVITHADAGAFELMRAGRYAGRFYAVPGYEEGHRERFSAHKGSYLVVDIPRFERGGFYDRFFASCEVDFESVRGGISARLYDCASIDPHDF